jgi:hypothetical protein
MATAPGFLAVIADKSSSFIERSPTYFTILICALCGMVL